MSYFYCSVDGEDLYVNCVVTRESYCIHKGGNYSSENIQKFQSLFEYKSVRFVYEYFLAFSPITKEDFLSEVFGKTKLKFW